MLRKADSLLVGEEHLEAVVVRLTSFFVRRNLTGFPQTYALPKLFMDIVAKLDGVTGDAAVAVVSSEARRCLGKRRDIP